tara:strand:- start:563 stop:892 length:330 start_codon:yes stop_codon:yes gene_type:complete
MANHLGRLRHRVQLQRSTNTTDTGGGMTKSYSILKDLFAFVRPVNGKELFRHGKVEETVTHEITIRYRADIGTNDKIVYDSREFNIRHIRNIDERNRYMLLVCTEGDAI